MNRQRHNSAATFGRWNRLALILVGILFVSWGGPAASAYWGSISSGFGAAKADSVAQGAKPATAVSGTNVTVTWTASTTTAGRSVTGYSIARYAAETGGTKVPATGTCAATVAALSCVEAGVPAGTWYYTVTPMLSLWQGPESLRSNGTTPVTDTTAPPAPVVTAPAFVHQGNVTGVPVTGTAEADSTVVLTISGTGALPVTQTITTSASGAWTAAPVNMTAFSDGIDAISYSAKATDAAGNTGPAGTAKSTKDVASPTVTGVQLSNGGGTAGVIGSGDKVTLTFSEALTASTVCNAWTSNTTTQTQGGNGVVTVSVSATDVLTVSSSGCAVNLGSIGLGGDYTTVPLTFNGNGGNASNLTWNPTARTLTITLGGVNVSGDKTVPATPPTSPTYAPASGITDIAGNPLATGTVTGAPSRF